MKAFRCDCGQPIFFDNTWCHGCGATLGYDPATAQLVALSAQPGEVWTNARLEHRVRLCRNRLDHGVCNWVVPEHDTELRCLACRLNRTIPDLSQPENFVRWSRLERAKRRLLSNLLAHGLPLQAPVAGFPTGLRFDFLEDRRSHPEIDLDFVTTGHAAGVITINVLEADDLLRAWQRELCGESYRTLLGHFRHECGHYYFELLVDDRNAFRALFGDLDQPYAPALRDYYAGGALPGWEGAYISAYASAHPYEDWAECFAHYLHITDTLETARERRLLTTPNASGSFREALADWDALSVSINELNRSLGLRDAYPFVITPAIAEKLLFVDQAIRAHAAR